MKKVIFLAVIIGILVFGANVFALDYSQINGPGNPTNAFGTGFTLNSGKNHGSIDFGFSGINHPFLTATLALAMTGNSFSDTLTLGTSPIATFSNANLVNGVYTVNFTGTALTALNSAIKSHALTFTLSRNSDSNPSTITSAALKGTMAPEPVSMALMGAGIVALPFARRLKKSLRKEA